MNPRRMGLSPTSNASDDMEVKPMPDSLLIPFRSGVAKQWSTIHVASQPREVEKLTAAWQQLINRQDRPVSTFQTPHWVLALLRHQFRDRQTAAGEGGGSGSWQGAYPRCASGHHLPQGRSSPAMAGGASSPMEMLLRPPLRRCGNHGRSRRRAAGARRHHRRDPFSQDEGRCCDSALPEELQQDPLFRQAGALIWILPLFPVSIIM